MKERRLWSSLLSVRENDYLFSGSIARHPIASASTRVNGAIPAFVVGGVVGVAVVSGVFVTAVVAGGADAGGTAGAKRA